MYHSVYSETFKPPVQLASSTNTKLRSIGTTLYKIFYPSTHTSHCTKPVQSQRAYKVCLGFCRCGGELFFSFPSSGINLNYPKSILSFTSVLKLHEIHNNHAASTAGHDPPSFSHRRAAPLIC